MPVLYFDNFRGFNKTFLPLKNVNFFVGENSSGKTSVLKLIKILSDHRFWFSQEFNSEEAELGYYSEQSKKQTTKSNNDRHQTSLHTKHISFFAFTSYKNQ